jgi:hypothetical protein
MMNKKLFALVSSLGIILFPITAFALNDVNDIIANILSFIVWPIFVGVVIIMFIYAGILFATASGDPGRVATAKKAVIWAFIGAIVGVAAYSAVNIIGSILGV